MPSLWEASYRHASYYCRALTSASEAFWEHGGRPAEALDRFELDWSNIRTGQRWSFEHCAEAPCRTLPIEYYEAGFTLVSQRRPPDDRIHWAEDALETARGLGDRKREGRILLSLGTVLIFAGQPIRALERLSEGIRVARETGDAATESQFEQMSARAHDYLGHRQEAIATLTRALRLARQSADRERELSCMSDVASTMLAVGAIKESLDTFGKAVKIAAELGDLHELARLACSMGDVFSSYGNVRLAMQSYEKALEIARRRNNPTLEGQALAGLAASFSSLGDNVKARDFLAQSRAAAEASGDLNRLALCLTRIAKLDQEEGNVEAARLGAERALDLCRRQGDLIGEMSVLVFTSGLPSAEFARRRPRLEAALALARQSGRRRQEASILGFMASLHTTLNEPEAALICHEQRLEIARAMADTREQAATLHEMGLFYLQVDNAQTALDRFDESLTLYRALDHRAVANLLDCRSLVLEALNRRDEALAATREAIDIYRKLEDPRAKQSEERLRQLQAPKQAK